MGLWRRTVHSSDGQNILGVLLLLLITWKIGAGKKWAWWLNTVVYSGSVAGVLLSFILAPEVAIRIWQALPVYAIALGISQYTLQGMAFALLLSTDSRKWFRVGRAHI
jgi:hypothetical protein